MTLKKCSTMYVSFTTDKLSCLVMQLHFARRMAWTLMSCTFRDSETAHKVGKEKKMKATFRQEWKASKKRILYTSIVLAAILLGTVLINFIAYKTKSSNITFFGMFLYRIGILAGTIGIPIYALICGSGNIRSLLFSDTNYLMLLIPEHSWN